MTLEMSDVLGFNLSCLDIKLIFLEQSVSSGYKIQSFLLPSWKATEEFQMRTFEHEMWKFDFGEMS